MDYTYKKIGDMDPEKMIDDLLKDDDDEGVPNRMDEEPETPENCPVDVKGVALDSDGDGCIDCLDKEPFSPPGYPIDENCVAIVPQIDPECCDKIGGANCDPSDLPSIHFASDKFYIQPEYYASLHIVGEKMLMCPDLKVVATGYTDVFSDQKYNEKLSWNRVNQAVEYLIDKYGISRDRFIVDYKGETEADESAPDLINRKVGFRGAEEGEAGDSNPADPHPSLKAGSEK
jgi:outer membrane protein OmpA-like peptidoglycan-associated protein